MAPLLSTKLSTFQLVFDYYQNSPGRIIKNTHMYITEYVKHWNDMPRKKTEGSELEMSFAKYVMEIC